MEKVRIGNDLRVNFSVYRNGEPESFDGATNISTKIINESYNKTIAHTYSIVDNVIQFNIDALELKQCGKCRVFISYTKVGDYTVDSPAFELVQYTEETGGTEVIGIEIVKINISGDIGINRDGASAYEVWESYPGNEGKTIEQYFEWLHENPTKVDTSRTITAGNGLTGGGDLTEDRTINIGNTDDSIVVGEDGIKVDTQDTLTSDSASKPLSAKQGKSLQDNKAEKTRNIVAGAGLTGGGDLSADITINVVAADDSLVVTADNVKVNTNNTLTSTSTTQPLSANQGKVLNEKVAQVETDLNNSDADFINAVNSLANNIGFDLGLGKKTDDTYRLLNIIGKRTGYVGYLGNYTLHGFEYTPGQNDDIVTLIGNTNYNTNKPIQSQMRPFEELISTKERFYLRDDVTKRIDGSASNLTDPNYLQKVYIPEFWYGAMFDSVRNKIQLWFSLIPVTGFMHIAPQAVCRYPGYIDGTGKARSHSGFKYPNNKNLIEFTTACQLTSDDLFVLPYYTYNALSLLLLHDIGRRNAQAVWAGLQTGSTYSNITSGKTDGLTAPSGEVPADAETASNKPFRWRFIENIYGDCWKILSGVYCNQVGGERRVMVCPDPYKANTSSVISADYVQACIIAAGAGWLKDINAPWINAKAYGASSTTGYCDYTYNNTTDKNILLAGGASYIGAAAGAFCLLSASSASTRSFDIGALFASIEQNKAATQIIKQALIY